MSEIDELRAEKARLFTRLQALRAEFKKLTADKKALEDHIEGRRHPDGWPVCKHGVSLPPDFRSEAGCYNCVLDKLTLAETALRELAPAVAVAARCTELAPEITGVLLRGERLLLQALAEGRLIA